MIIKEDLQVLLEVLVAVGKIFLINSIELNPDYALAYVNRGASKDNLKDYKGSNSRFH